MKNPSPETLIRAHCAAKEELALSDYLVLEVLEDGPVAVASIEEKSASEIASLDRVLGHLREMDLIWTEDGEALLTGKGAQVADRIQERVEKMES